MFFLLFLHDDRRIRIQIREAKKHVDPVDPDSDPEHWFFVSVPGWVGIPNFYGFGSGLVGGQRVRFLVLSRLGADIQKFFQSGDRPLPLATALNIAIQIIDSLGNANNTRSLNNIIVWWVDKM